MSQHKMFWEIIVDENVFDLQDGDLIELYDGTREFRCKISQKCAHSPIFRYVVGRAVNIIRHDSSKEEDYEFYSKFYISEGKIFDNSDTKNKIFEQDDMIGNNRALNFELQLIE